VQETEEEQGKILVIGKPSFLVTATILTILVSATGKVRDHLRGLVRGYLDDRVRLQSWNINLYNCKRLK
jgi:hypothetical protein